ncbi:MAG: PepB aminopeptidase [Paraglaciecola sp.]|jgi:PepB aminopeptidase
MSQLAVQLTHQPAPAHWGKGAILSFSNELALIHLPQQDDPLRVIRRAARSLDGLSIEHVRLVGEWQIEQQWALATSFTTVNKQDHIEWLDDENKAELERRYQALVFTRNQINATPEDLSPQELALSSVKWLQTISPDKISYKMVTGDELAEQGWMGIYHVGRGSTRPPVLLEVDYNPTGDELAPVDVALVGKGITFDSGGYSIKSSEGMLSMKCDMGGAATVTGGLGLAIMRGLNKRVKLFLCCAENLISGHAYKLGDVITYKNGTTVEIVNTDAEGRLVLADGLLAATETGAPLIIDAATLTGAAHVAMGDDYNAFLALDKGLLQRMLAYAEEEFEPAWGLPLEIWHQEKCPSPFADTANSRAQKGGGAGGASNAAGFLSRFVANNGAGWLHMDLAAAYNASANQYVPAGATAQGIRTIAKALQSE